MSFSVKKIVLLFLIGIFVSGVSYSQNDHCTGAVPILCGDTLSGSTLGASLDTVVNCGGGYSAPGVWYVFEGTGEQVIATTCGIASYDTKLSVFMGDCNNLYCIAANDDGQGCAANSSEVVFNSLTGTNYYILVHGWASSAGDFNLGLICSPGCLPSPANDYCINAQPVPLSSNGSCVSVLGDNTCASSSVETPSCDPFSNISSVFFSFNSGSNSSLNLHTSLVSAGFIHASVYESCGGAEVSCINSANGSITGLDSNSDYLLQFWNTGDPFQGTFEFCLEEPPACPNPTLVSPGLVNENQAETFWTSTNPGAIYNIEYGPTGFSTGSGSSLMGSSVTGYNLVVINGLSPSSSYDFYLWEDCGNGDHSDLAGPYTFMTSAPSSGNGYCGNAMMVSCGDTVIGSTINTNVDIAPNCGPGTVTASGVWYQYTGTGSSISLSTCGTADFDTKINVYKGDCFQLECVSANDDYLTCSNYTSSLSFFADNNESYYILVHGAGSSTGNFQLSVTCEAICGTAPLNDNCSGAFPLPISVPGSCSTVTASNECSSQSFPNPSCDPFNSTMDVWYSFYSGNYDEMFFEVNAISSGNVGLSIYDQCGGNVVFCQANFTSQLISNLTPNKNYLVQFWTVSGTEGLFDICVTRPDPALNDMCQNAVSVSCGMSISGSTMFGAIDPVPNCGTAAVSAPGIWYHILGTGDEFVIGTCGTADFDTKIGVYEGFCGTLNCIVGNDDFPGCADYTSQVNFTSVLGQNYYILVHGFGSLTGSFDLNVNCLAPCNSTPSNDDCSNAEPLTVFQTTLCQPTMGTNVCATSYNGFVDCDFFGNVQDVWYSFNSGNNTELLASLNSVSGGSYGMALYDACGGQIINCKNPWIGTDTLWVLTPNTDYQLQIWNAGLLSAGMFNVCLEEITSTCELPVGFVISNVLSTSAEISWTSPNPSSSYILEYGESGFSPGTGSGSTMSGASQPGANSLSVGGLMNGMSYDFYLQEDCGFGSTNWVGPISITTLVPQVSNDDCIGSIPLVCGQLLTGSTLGAMVDNVSDCGPALASGPGVWYSFMGTGDQWFISLCNSSFDTQLGIYTGDCGSLNCLIGNDVGTSCLGLTSDITLQTDSGIMYYILINGYQNQVGSYQIEASCFPACDSFPSNDDCQNAIPVTLSSPGFCNMIEGDNSCSTYSLQNTSCDPYGSIYDIWYSFNSSAYTEVEISVNVISGAQFKFGVYDACGGNEVDCGLFGSNTITGLTPNTDYLLQVGNGGGNHFGSFEFCVGPASLSCATPQSPVALNISQNGAEVSWVSMNDSADFEIEYGISGFMTGSGSVMTGVSTLGTNTFQLNGLNPVSDYDFYITESCGAGGQSYLVGPVSFTTSSPFCPNPVSLTVSSIDTSFATVNWASSNQGAAFSIEWGPQGFTPGSGTGSQTGISLQGQNSVFITGLMTATTYDVYIQENCGPQSSSGNMGPITFETSSGPEFNDLCENATSISCGQNLNGTTVGSTLDTEANCGSSIITSGGVWYHFVGTGEQVVVSTCGQANFDTKIGIYSGECGMLECVAGNDDGLNCSNFTSEVSFNSSNGESYYFLVHGYQLEQGTFELSVNCEPACSPLPSNDVCSSAMAMDINTPDNCMFVSGDNSCSSMGLQNPGCDAWSSIYDVWYTFNTGILTEVSLNIQSISSGNLNVALYDACGASEVSCEMNVSQVLDYVGLLPNQNYLIRVWTQGGADKGTFELCLIGEEPCLNPTSLEAVVINSSKASLFWESGNPGSSYTLEWGYSGFTQGNGLGSATGISVSGLNTTDATGLQDSTSYDFYVREDCGDGDLSEWEGPLTFNTMDVGSVPFGNNSVNLELFPNPNSGDFTIDMDYAGLRDVNVIIFGSLGQTVFSKSLGFITSDTQCFIKTESLSSGIYYVRIRLDADEFVKKVIIK